MKLRPYQVELVKSIYREIKNGRTSIAAVAPTGAGKTVCITQIVAHALTAGKRVCICVDRNVLIPQTFKKFKQWDSENIAETKVRLQRLYETSPEITTPILDDIPIELLKRTGVIKSKYPEYRDLPIQLISLQSLAQVSRLWAQEFPWDIIILDEAHETAWRNITKKLFKTAAANNSIILGFTATPYRLKKNEGFSEKFDSLTYTCTPAQLQAEGYLSPIEYYSFEGVDLSEVGLRAGDYKMSDLSVAVNRPELIEQIYEQWMRLVPGKPTLAFCVDVEHAVTVAEYFNSQGVPSAVVTATTPEKERERLYAAIEAGELVMLSSVNVVSTGFDSPCIEVGLGLRPTKSLALLHQQIGRIMRISPGKMCGYWLDQAGNLSPDFGDMLKPEEITDYSLSTSKPKRGSGTAPYKYCVASKLVSGSGCGHEVHASATHCTHCGSEFEKRAQYVMPTGDFVRINVEAPSEDPRYDLYREYLRKCRRKTWNPSKAAVDLSATYRDFYPPIEWCFGAVYGENPTEAEYVAYANYLMKVQAKAALSPTWCHSWFVAEFGSDSMGWLLAWLEKQSVCA